jgi:hypothetical protein
MFLCITVSDLFISGLFYDTERNEESEEQESEESLKSSFESYTWSDFWIMVYTILFTVPVPIILAILFKRRKFEIDEPEDKIRKTLVKQKIK